MKAKQLKRIINFILQYHQNHTNKSIRALLKSNPEQFIDLLNETVEQAESVPNSVVNFMTEVGKQVLQVKPTESPKQKQPTKENPTMNNQKKTSIIMRLVTVVKGAWAKAVQLLTSNKGKVKLAMSAVTIAAVAIVTSKGTAILAVLAALKSRGLVDSIMNAVAKVGGLFSNTKVYALDKLSSALGYLHLGGAILLSKMIALKNFIVEQAKQAWSWVLDLFSVTTESESYPRAA